MHRKERDHRAHVSVSIRADPCSKRSRVFPSLDTIARMALVCKRTVLNAIAWLALYGFLDRLRRIVRATGLLGPRVRQTSNAHALRFPKGLGGLAVNVFRLAPECKNALLRVNQ